MLEETARFLCEDDAGNTLVLIERTNFLSVRLISRELGTAKGTVEYTTDSNLWANDNGDGTFSLEDGRLVRPAA